MYYCSIKCELCRICLCFQLDKYGYTCGIKEDRGGGMVVERSEQDRTRILLVFME